MEQGETTHFENHLIAERNLDQRFLHFICGLQRRSTDEVVSAAEVVKEIFRVIARRQLSRRFVVILTFALCAAVVSGIARTASVADREQLLSRSDDWYCLGSSAGGAVCLLSPGSGRYTLVIGCLADSSGSHEVRIKLTDEFDPSAEIKRVEQSVRLPRTTLRTEPTNNRSVSASSSDFISVFEPKDWTFRQINRSRQSDIGQEQKTSIGDTRDFFIHVTDGELNDPKQYARMTAQCVGEGARVRVFVDRQLGTSGLRESQVEDLIHLLENDVIPRVEAQFGTLIDVDHDGRFAIVISPWLSRLQGGRVSINGMVRSSDFHRDVRPPLGNQCDMLLLNSSLPSRPALCDLLSHEVAHAACVSQRVKLQATRLGDEQDWVSEGLAHLAEPSLTNSAERIATFLTDPSQHPLVVPDYYRAGLWRDPGSRGATVLFSKWCVKRHGHDLCRRLAQSSESGCRSFEQATSERFEDLFRQWSVSVVDEWDIQSSKQTEPNDFAKSTNLRRQISTIDGAEVVIKIQGTAFSIVELPEINSPSVMLRIDGDSAAHWQYSMRCNMAQGPTVKPSVVKVRP